MTTDDGHGVPQSFGGTSEGLVSGRRVHCQLDDFRRPMKAAATTQASPIRSWRRPRRLSERTGEGFIMTDDIRDHDDFWYRGQTTRRRVLGYGVSAGALGAAMLVPAPWQAAFGQAKPYKVGTLQPLSGPAAPGGKTALVGLQMAVDRINKAGGINGRPVEIVVADDESKPDVGRRKTEKLLAEDKGDAHVCGL